MDFRPGPGQVALVEYPGAGHMLMYERTDDVDALIMDFARACQAVDDRADERPASASAG